MNRDDNQNYTSWGNLYPPSALNIRHGDWRFEPLATDHQQTMLAYGNGRSYGDSCLNDGATLLDTRSLNRFIAFDRTQGLLTVEAGMLLGDILEIIVPAGWFLPVVPGTRQVTVGGCIANDIHGKNHHLSGSFGCHIKRFELLRSSGERLICSAEENTALFNATVGGLGLTGLIVWAEIQLKAINSDQIEFEEIPFHSLAEFSALSTNSADWEYTAAWIDCLNGQQQQRRGIFNRGRHSSEKVDRQSPPRDFLAVPFTPPCSLINSLSLKAFNSSYFYLHSRNQNRQQGHYRPFLFPLDGVAHWNRIYGPRGFYQYQCVVPELHTIEALLDIISESRSGSFLAVLKAFGDIPSPGLISFPRKGLTLALDFPNHGQSTVQILDKLDAVVLAAGGAVYPAKDAHMSPETFAAFYPNTEELRQHQDPLFSSSFWRRVSPCKP